MIKLGLGIAAIFLGVAMLSFCLALTRFVIRRKRIALLVGGMDSGVYVEYGMVIDPQTGLVTPQQRPSLQAYQHLI